jgi:hypothetical protein
MLLSTRTAACRLGPAKREIFSQYMSQCPPRIMIKFGRINSDPEGQERLMDSNADLQSSL